MCVIFILQKGYTLPYSLLENACHNNPHGYGIIIRRGEDYKDFEVIKRLHEGGNDPKEIYDILKDNEDADRFVHLRWATRGGITEENTQPFTVYDDGKRRIEFMHNGTLGNYGTYTVYRPHGTAQAAPEGKSDSLEFSQKVLSRFLPKTVGDHGVADITDPEIMEIFDKYWVSGNRGILVCNNLEPFIFSPASWEMIETSEVVMVDDEPVELKGKLFASNNDYFERLKRGPLFERLEEEKRRAQAAKEAQEKQKREEAAVERGVTVPFPASPGFSSRFGISENMSDVLEDFDLYQPQGYIEMANLTYTELFTLAKLLDHDDMAGLLLHLTHFLRMNTLGFTEAVRKNKKNVETIAELALRIERYEKERDHKDAA